MFKLKWKQTQLEAVLRSSITIIALIFFLFGASATYADEVLTALAKVSEYQSQRVTEELEAIAEKQRDNIDKKEAVREIQDMYDELLTEIRVAAEVLESTERVIEIRKAETADESSEDDEDSSTEIDWDSVRKCVAESG